MYDEREFRRVETRLDALLMDAEAELRYAGVRVQDESVRTYHYKAHGLCWKHSFLREWIVGAETARITVHVEFGEPLSDTDGADIPNIHVEARAEVFLLGRPSRIDERSRSARTLAEIERLGMAQVVFDAMRQCEPLLPVARP